MLTREDILKTRIPKIKGNEEIDKMEGTIRSVERIVVSIDKIVQNPTVATILKKRFGLDVEKVNAKDVSEAAKITSQINLNTDANTAEAKRKRKERP